MSDDERRGGARLRTLHRGVISYRDGAIRIDCIVRELSGDGARLILDGPETLPERFFLSIPHLEIEARRVHLRWVRGTTLGVDFEPEAPVASALSPPNAADEAALARRVEMMEQEVVRLNRLLGEVRAELRRSRGG